MKRLSQATSITTEFGMAGVPKQQVSHPPNVELESIHPLFTGGSIGAREGAASSALALPSIGLQGWAETLDRMDRLCV